MKLLPLIALAVAATTPVFAEETRQLDAHEHGVGQLDIAFDGKQISMELHAPGADIVSFEYAAESAEDRAKVDAAVAMLARPLDLFVLTEAAGCTIVQASAELESEEGQADHEDETTMIMRMPIIKKKTQVKQGIQNSTPNICLPAPTLARSPKSHLPTSMLFQMR